MQKIEGLVKNPVSVSITDDQLQFIDEQRKGKSKAQYIRSLIDKEKESIKKDKKGVK